MPSPTASTSAATGLVGVRQLRVGPRLQPTFGLIGVDRSSVGADPEPSAAWYAAIVEANALTDTAVELDLR